MAQEITVPRLGWTMEEGTFGGWLKPDGAEVKEGEPLFTVESDKAEEGIEALASGILRISPGGPEAGDVVAVGKLLGHLVKAGEAAPVPAAGSPTPAPSTKHVAKAQPSGSQLLVHAPGTESVHRRRAAVSPRARRVARELNVDYSKVRGSGRTGRIVERDIRAAASTARATQPSAHVRKLIAERMLTSAQTTASVTLITKADATELKKLREQLKTVNPTLNKSVPSVTDLFLKLTAAALAQHPSLNSRWDNGQVVIERQIHIGVAVDTPAGLLVPVLRDVQQLTLDQIAAASRSLLERAHGRQLRPDEFQGGTFTITNLGMHGIDAFTPIINLPQCAVLGLGRIVREPAVFQDQIVPRDMLTLSLTFDHRVVDGAPAARFLNALSRAVEQPFPWLINP